MSAIIHFMFNMQPHYHHVMLDAPYETITVKVVLDEAYKAHKSVRVLAGEPECPREKFQLRYITGESYGFSIPPDGDQDKVLERALAWYENKGHFLQSTCIGPHESTLVKSIVTAPDTGVVRLYVIAAADVTPTLSTAEAPPLLAKRRQYIAESEALLALGEATSPPNDEDAQSSAPYHRTQSRYPNLGPWAPFHEPVFAFAYISLHGMLPVKPDTRPLDENFEVLDADAFDPLICVSRMIETLDEVKHAPDNTCIEALSKLLRGLFDDPTLEVNATQITEGGHLSTELEIRGECQTVHGFPALYVIGKVKLQPGFWKQREVEGFVAYKHALVGSKYAAVREMTCCPCLIIAIEGYNVQFYAAYFSDVAYHVRLCEIPLLDSWSFAGGPRGEYSNAFKLQIIRRTAQELRRAYSDVHTGSAIPNAPHLFPWYARFPIPELPFPLYLVDRVPVSPCSIFPVDVWNPWLHFTGFIPKVDGTRHPVHVEFIGDQGYCVKAHRLLAEHELKGKPMPLAPSFTYRDLFPDVKMVIVSTLEGDTLEHLLASGATVSQDDLKDVYTAVRLLHRHGFVHGNIRLSNVIIRRPDPGDLDSTTRSYLVNFDLAGKVGKARYPSSNMLNSNIRWPSHVFFLVNKPITKRDDLFMLKNLLPPGAGTKTEHDAPTTAGGPEAHEWQTHEEEAEETEEIAATDSDDESSANRDAIWSALGIIKDGKAADFGRTGSAHKAVYPVDIKSDIVWQRPADEFRCQPITKPHDQFMLDQTLCKLLKGYAGDEGRGEDSEDASGLKRKLESNDAGEDATGSKKHKPNNDSEDEEDEGTLE